MHPKNKHQTGFTIVELLIVIVVIGILAAITIVAYNGIQNRAYNVNVQNDLASMAKKIAAENAINGVHPLPTAAMDMRFNRTAYQTSQNNLYFCRNDSTNEFALSARSRNGTQYKYTQATGVTTHSTTLWGAETCALVGVASWSGSYGAVGWDSNNTLWSPWVK